MNVFYLIVYDSQFMFNTIFKVENFTFFALHFYINKFVVILLTRFFRQLLLSFHALQIFLAFSDI